MTKNSSDATQAFHYRYNYAMASVRVHTKESFCYRCTSIFCLTSRAQSLVSIISMGSIGRIATAVLSDHDLAALANDFTWQSLHLMRWCIQKRMQTSSSGNTQLDIQDSMMLLTVVEFKKVFFISDT